MKSHFNFFLGSLALLSMPNHAWALDGTWNVDAGGTWSIPSNWLSSTIADGSGFTANFTNDITADLTVSLDGDRTLTNLVFGDANTATAGSWVLDNNGVSTNNLILAGTPPTITVNSLGAGKTATISAIIEGAAGLAKAGTGTLILSGNNIYTGGTAINAGTLQVDTGGSLGSTSGALSMGTGSSGVLGTVGNLTVNTNTQVGAFSVQSNTANISGANIGQLLIDSGKTLTVSSLAVGVSQGVTNNFVNTALGTGSSNAGTLTVTGDVTVGLSTGGNGNYATTVADLSGLANFNAGSGAGTFRVGYGILNRATMTLASTANVINVATISVGETTSNGNSSQNNILNLGAGTNALRATNINIGTQKASGVIQFAGSNGSVVISGIGGTGSANISLGNNNSSGTYQPGNLNNGLLLAGHTATVNAGTVIIGNRTFTGAGTITSQMTFDTGTFNASSITLARATNGHASSASAVNGTLTLGTTSASTGITNVSGNVLLASHTSSTAGVQTATGVLNILGGILNVNTAASSTGGILDNSTTTTGVVNTTMTLNGGTLNLNGGVIGGTGVSGSRLIGTLNFRSGTLKNVAQINNGVGLTKTTSGTLILEGTNAYGGITAVSEGVLNIRSATALGATTAGTTVSTGAALEIQGGITTAAEALSLSGTGVSNGGALRNISGTNTYSGAITLGAAARINSDADTLTLDVASGNAITSTDLGVTFGGAGNIEVKDAIALGTGTLDKDGNGTLTLSAGTTHNYSGATTVTSGKLVVDGNISTSTTTVKSTGILGGIGTVGGVLVEAGGKLAPGNSAGTLTVSGALTLNSLSKLAFELNPADTTIGAGFNDLVTGVNELTLDGLLTVTATSGSFAGVTSGTWRLINYTGTFNNNTLSFDSMPTLASGYSWTLDTSTAGQINLTVIPEPRAALLGGIGILLLLRRRRG